MIAISHKGTIDPISAAFFIIKTCYATSDVRFEVRTSLGLSMPTRRSLLTTQLDRLGRSKVTELCSRTGTELDLADQTLVVVSISTPVGQIPFSVPQIASRLTRCACCLALRLDRTSLAEPTCAAVGEVLKTQEFSKRPEGRNRQAECTTMA